MSMLQWGRGLKTPEMEVSPEGYVAIYLLQWGRGLKTPEIIPPTAKIKQIRSLQWGRGLKTPEIQRHPHPGHRRHGLQWGRGLKTPEMAPRFTVSRTRRRFNGAGALRPRKSFKQGLHRKASSASMGPGP